MNQQVIIYFYLIYLIWNVKLYNIIILLYIFVTINII